MLVLIIVISVIYVIHNMFDMLCLLVLLILISYKIIPIRDLFIPLVYNLKQHGSRRDVILSSDWCVAWLININVGINKVTEMLMFIQLNNNQYRISRNMLIRLMTDGVVIHRTIVVVKVIVFRCGNIWSMLMETIGWFWVK